MNKKILLPIVVLLVLVAAVLFLLRLREDGISRDVLMLSGNLELREVEIAFKTPGRLVELNVEEGDPVAEGALVARLDAEPVLQEKERAEAQLRSLHSRRAELEALIRFQEANVEAQVDQRRAEVRQAEVSLQELVAGARSQEIEQAGAAAELARAEFEKAKADWGRAQTLYKDEDISTAQYDQYGAAYAGTKAGVRQAEERYDLLREGSRRETIDASRAMLERAEAGLRQAEAQRLDIRRNRKAVLTLVAEAEAAEAQVALMESRVQDTFAYSPISGIVLVKSAEVGEIVGPGSPVVSVGEVARPWVRAYIEEPDLGKVKVGDAAEVTTDSYPEKVYSGRISFVASEAEFTPKQIQTREQRVKLVYRIKIDVENPEQELKQNMPVDVRIRLGAGVR